MDKIYFVSCVRTVPWVTVWQLECGNPTRKILFSFVCKYKHNIRTYSKPYVHMMRFAKFLQENFVCIDDCELNRPDPLLTILNTSEHASPIKYFPLFELNQSIYLLFYLMRT